MNKAERFNYEPTRVPHPGEMVTDYLDHHAWSQRELARRSGLTPKTISEICGGKGPITPPTALAFEKVFGRPAHFWLNLQRRFDEAAARDAAREKSVAWKTWAAKFPMKHMKQYGWFEKVSGRDDTDALLSFFAVSSPQSWATVWDPAGVAYRQTRKKVGLSEEATAAWVRAAELDVEDLTIAAFDAAKFRTALQKIRQATRKRFDEVLQHVREVCAASGVGVAFVHELPNTGISGCAKWLSNERALIGLSLRYKTDDQIWFTFFHEAGHILLHRRDRPFVLDNAETDLSDRIVDPDMQQVEDEANRFAADTLIPADSLAEFIRRGMFTNETIQDFAEAVDIAPGIVVGRLQFEQVLAPHQGNKLKQRLDWGTPDEE